LCDGTAAFAAVLDFPVHVDQDDADEGDARGVGDRDEGDQARLDRTVLLAVRKNRGGRC